MRPFRRLGAALGARRVQETAACARALAAHAGPDVPLLPGGAEQVTRAALTAAVMAHQDPVPWPWAITRQLDPDDPAYLPALGMHPVLAARDLTRLGLPGGHKTAWVDPSGWAGVAEGPALTVWFGDARRGFTMGRGPGQPSKGAPVVQQRRSDGLVGVLSSCTVEHLTLELLHWPVVLEGRTAWAVHARLSTTAEAPHPVRLAFALRPAGPEGSAPVFELLRDADGLWTADGVPVLAVARRGDELLGAHRGQADPWLRFSGAAHTGPGRPPGPLSVRCAAGQATAAEVYRSTLSPGEQLDRLAVLMPPRGTPAALVRTSGRTLWAGASADRQGQLSAGANVVLSQHALLFEATRLRLLMEPEACTVASCLGAVCLGRLGFVRRAGDRLGRWLERVRRDGRMPGGSPELPAVLAWAAGEFITWTHDAGWVREHQSAWRRLLDRLMKTAPEPGGRALFGPGGSHRWTRIWRCAGLLSSAAALRGVAEEQAGWAIAGGRLREELAGHLGPAPWSACEDRAPDGSAAAMLASAWLGVVPHDHPAVAQTLAFVRQRHWHGGGVLLLGGAHVAATALWSGVQARIDPTFDAVGTIAALASDAQALPTARHPWRGALGHGDDPLSAALFMLLALDTVQVWREHITVLPGLVSADNLPTPFGPIDVVAGAGGRSVRGRWRGTPPHVRLVEDGSA